MSARCQHAPSRAKVTRSRSRRVVYGEHCVVPRGGSVRDGERRPTLGKGCILYPGSTVMGDCFMGENAVVRPGVARVNHHTPGGCNVVETESSRPRRKEAGEYYDDRYFMRT